MKQIAAKNLTRHGNSLALVIDKPLLELLGIGPDTPLQLQTDGVSLLVRPVRELDERHREQLRAAWGTVKRVHSKSLARIKDK